MGGDGCESFALAGHFVDERLVAIDLGAGDHDVLEIRQPPEHIPHHRQQRTRNEKHPRTAVGEDVGVLLARQQRIQGHRDDAGPHSAEKHHGEIDRVQHDHRDALFAPDAEALQQVGKLTAPGLQAAVSEIGYGVRESELVATPFCDVAIQQPGHRIVRIGQPTHDAAAPLVRSSPFFTVNPLTFMNYNSYKVS